MLVVSTFNIQNDNKKYQKNKAKEIYNYLEKNQIDILNMQEVFLKFEKDFLALIKNKFNIYGKYRYLIKKLPFSEKVGIVTDKKVIKTKTYRLPHFPSPLNRIVTKTIIEYNHKNITVLNTHLDYKYNKVKEKQLEYLLKMIKKEKNPLILTGDFNLKTNNLIFKKFISELEKQNIKLIKTNDKTLKWSIRHRPIDHVFCSNQFKVIDKKIITNIKSSDHYPVLVKLELK